MFLPQAPSRKPSFSQQLNVGVGKGLEAASQLMQQNQLEKLHPELAGLSDEYQKMGFESKLKQQEQSKKFQQENQFDEEGYKDVENYFGKEFANIWKASEPGARTKLIGAALQAKERGMDIGEMLRGNSDVLEKPEENNEPLENQDIQNKKEKVLDFDKGLTPAERTRRQDKRYEKGLPLMQESQKRKHAFDTIGEELKTLEQLSPQISGFERLNINPMTGDLLIPALASPEAQQFVKTINDFTIQAKDSYGARVTNFDLNQFMRRLPTLANSEEGRRRILEQMSIINNLNKMYEQSLHDVFDQYGGLRNIDYDRASEIAYNKFEKESKPLRADLKKLSSAETRDFSHIVSEKKRNAPSGQVLMMTKDGKFGYVPKNEMAEALKDGLVEP